VTTVISVQDQSTRRTSDHHNDLILEQNRKAENTGVEVLGLAEVTDIEDQAVVIIDLHGSTLGRVAGPR